MFDRTPPAPQEREGARADRRLKGLVGNKRVDEGAVQRLGDSPKRSQLDAPFLLGSLEVNPLLVDGARIEALDAVLTGREHN